ncbi:hypothetical protein KIM372_16890 [Bombiscardovia nodaiensis]|uniref:Uncharacterized protein n=1 Tax=Bombiscardovia nodaiensis TaxID=2932181 RepID=A0ABN6SET1_9BIFI|nr:hypothetical protein KIM372_16890 [Bombiscardovia nodaiensis]
MPRGLGRKPPVSQEEAEEFLGQTLLAVFKPNAQLAASLTGGLGLEGIPRSYRKPLARVVQGIEELASLEPSRKPPRAHWIGRK